jgi:uncharacterized protein (TIGR02266 family)
MTADDKRAAHRHPVALRIRLRYTQVEQFISKFATNLSRGGMFLATKSPRPVGTTLRFEIVLADNSPVIEGTGEVRWVADYDRDDPSAPHGMGVRFIELTPASAALLDKVLALRAARGDAELDEVPPPPRRARAATPRPRRSSRKGSEPTASAPEAPTPEAPAPAAPEAAPPSRRPGRVTAMLADSQSDVVGEHGRRVADAVRRARQLAEQLAVSGPDDDALEALLDPAYPAEHPFAGPDDAVPRPTVDEASQALAEMLGGSSVDSRRYRAPDLVPSVASPTTERLPAQDDDAPRSRRLETIDAAIDALDEEAEAKARALRRARKADEAAAMSAIEELRQGSLAVGTGEPPVGRVDGGGVEPARLEPDRVEPARVPRGETEIPIDLDDPGVMGFDGQPERDE